MVENLAPPRIDPYIARTQYLLPDDTAATARSIMRRTGARILPVVADEKTMKLMGVVRRRSLLLLTSTRSQARAAEIAEEPRLVLAPGTGLREATEEMLRLDEWYAPVTGPRGELLGVIGLEAALRYMIDAGVPALANPVEKYMTRNPVYVEPGEPVYRVWQLMLSRGISAVPVVKKGRIVGVVAEYDLLAHGFTRPALEAGEPRKGPRVEEVMSTPPVTVTPTAPLRDAVSEMLRRDIGRVYVVDEHQALLGVLDRSDAARAWLQP